MSSKIIGYKILKALKSKDRAKLYLLHCECDNCSIYKQGCCLKNNNWLLGKNCPYGKITSEETVTKKSKKYREQVSFFENRVKDIPLFPNYYNLKKIETIGEYYFFPYSHIALNLRSENTIPFLEKETFGFNGIAMLKKEDFNASVVNKIFNFRPQSLMGGVISDFEKKELPKFLFNLKKDFPKLYEESCKLNPNILDATPTVKNIIRDKKYLLCKMKHIPSGITSGYMVEESMEPVFWDGKKLTVLLQDDFVPELKEFKDKNTQHRVFNLFIAKTSEIINISFFPDLELNVQVFDNNLAEEILSENSELF